MLGGCAAAPGDPHIWLGVHGDRAPVELDGQGAGVGVHGDRAPVVGNREVAVSTQYVAVGPPMQLVQSEAFVVQGQRFRSSARTVLDLSATTVTLRIGVPGSAALIEQELTLDDSDPLDPSYYCTLSAVQTATLTAGAAYEYVFVAGDGRAPLLQGPVSVDAVPRPM